MDKQAAHGYINLHIVSGANETQTNSTFFMCPGAFGVVWTVLAK